jgi:hypothetical protein
MGSLAQLQSSSCANPVLELYTLADVASLQYQIFNATTVVPTQVYPTSAGTKATVDVDTACPTGDKLGAGHYVARWTASSTQAVGRYQVKWYVKLTDDSTEEVEVEDFEVVLSTSIGSSKTDYCLLQDLRDEGVASATVPDLLLAKRIALASRFIEAATKRFFYPRAMSINLDGTGGAAMLLQQPIIALTGISLETTTLLTDIELDNVRVYNRHLSQRLTDPDDRSSPKIELFNTRDSYGYGRLGYTALRFPVGEQNVAIDGVFGYTDPGLSMLTAGVTPEMIRHVCKLITMRELSKLSKVAARSEGLVRHRLTSERTRDQAYSLAPLGTQMTGAFFTGDPEVDNVLAFFQRPPVMGAV